MADIPEIAPNSYKSGAAKQKEVTNYQVMPTSANAISKKTKKKSKKILSLILPEDIPDLTTYIENQADDIVRYVIWPKIRDMLIDSFSSLLGGGVRRTNTLSSGGISRVSYDTKYRGAGILPRSNIEARRQYSLYENIGFNNPADADLFKQLVTELFDDQGYIKVLQYYNIANRSTTPEQNNYGWYSLNGMRVYFEDGMYWVDMPWPVPIP